MRTLREEREAAQAWEDNDMPTRYGLGMILGLLGLAFCIGDVVGHVMVTRSVHSRFAPGRYLIEPSAPSEDEPGWIVNYTSAWEVNPLPPRPMP